jgi:formylglycine-generating enzyme required for sulfatase activity
VATGPAASAVTLEWVTVTGTGTCDQLNIPLCFGGVTDHYLIGKYEVTNAEYAEFLNAVAYDDTYGLYNESMGDPSTDVHGGITRSGSPGSYSYSAIAGREDMPVNYVSFYDALRFVNWLENGQPTGVQDASTTEDGTYTMIVEDYDAGPVIVPNVGATFFLPNEDEWHQAAYYDAGSTSYFDYPAGTDTETVCAVPGATANTANCGVVVPPTGGLAEVGSYTGSPSPSGTFDQGGNVREWTEGINYGTDVYGRYARGGRFNRIATRLGAAYRTKLGPDFPTHEASDTGFRVASLSAGPECSDGVDNDGDGYVDFPEDPGCEDAASAIEDPACQDGLDNDGDGVIDFDGGQSIWGDCADPPVPFGCPPEVSDLGDDGIPNADTQCANKPWKDTEKATGGGGCGLGAELAVLLPGLLWLYGRRRKTS